MWIRLARTWSIWILGSALVLGIRCSAHDVALDGVPTSTSGRHVHTDQTMTSIDHSKSNDDKSGIDPDNHFELQFDQLDDLEDYTSVLDLTTSLSSILFRLLQASSTSASDFASFNELFQNTKIHLPNEKLVQKVVFNEFILDVSNVICYNVRLEDMAVDHTLSSSTSALTLNVSMQVSMDCDMDYWYGFGSIRGSGSLVAKTSRNQLESTLQVSPGNATVPPIVTMNACSATVDIVDLEFDGGVVASIADTLRNMIAMIVEKQVSGLICDKLSQLGSGMLKNAIANLNQRMKPYLTAEPHTPLWFEHGTIIGPNILNLNAETGLGSLLSIAIRQLDLFLAGRVSDVGGPTGTGSDLSLNVMLRDRLLNDDRSFDLNMSSIANPVILNRSDQMTDTTITIDAVKVFGLDTLKEFSGLDVIGNRTLQSMLQWDYLTVNIDMTVSMKASSRSDSIIEGATTREIVEQVSVVLGVDDLNVAVALLVQLDEDKLGALQLGSLLFSDRLVPCLLSALDDLHVTGLNVTVSDVQDPTIEGFVTPGFDEVIAQLVKAALAVYEPTFLRAIPGAFQMLVRKAINEQYLPDMLVSASCTPPGIVDTFVDLRDLFLAPAMAKLRGGSGEQQYGDIGHLLYEAIQSIFTAPAPDGSAGINENFVRPMTLAQSGSEGVIRIKPEYLIDLEKDDVGMLGGDRLRLSLSDVQIANVDAFRAPLDLLQPTDLPFETNSTLKVGNLYQDKLTASVRFRIAVDGDASPLQMSNEVDFSASANSLSLGAVVQTMLLSKAFQEFQLRYVMDASCWLSLFPKPEAGVASPFEIDAFVTRLASFEMNASCVSCTSPGTAALPVLVGMVSNAKTFPVLALGLQSLAESFAAGGSINAMLTRLIEDSHQICPMSPTYDSSANKLSWVLEPPKWPVESVDALMLATGIAAASGLTVFVLSHDTPHEYQDALSAQASSEVPGNIKLLDWMDLENSLGIGKLPNSLFSQLRDAVTQTDKDGSLRINSVLDSNLLDNGAFRFAPDWSWGASGIVATLDSVEVYGLNTFTSLDVLKPIAPQTLQNNIMLENLGFIMSISVGTADEMVQQVSVSFNASDVSIDLAVFAAFDLDKMGSITLESFFAMENIIPCLLSTAHSFEIPRFIVDVGSVSRPLFKGLRPASSLAMTSIISSIADQFGSNLTAAIPFLFDGTGRSLANSIVNQYIASNNACDSEFEDKEAPVFVDFRDLFLSPGRAKQLGGSGLAPYGSLFRRLFDLVVDRFLKIDPATGLSDINDVLISKLTETQSGTSGRLEFSSPFNTETRINVGGLDANVRIQLYDAFVDNLDTIGEPLSLLAPTSLNPSELNNTATIGVGPALQMGGRFIFALTGDDMDIANDVALGLSVDKLSVIATTLVQVDGQSFRSFPIRDVFNQYCWLATIPYETLDARGVRIGESPPSLSLKRLGARIAEVNMSSTCMNCSSPGMHDLSTRLSTPEASISLTKSINNFLDYLSMLLGGPYLQTTFDRLLVESQRRCPHSKLYEESPRAIVYDPFVQPDEEGPAGLFFALAITLLVIGVIVWVLVLTIQYVVTRRNRKWLRDRPSGVIRQLWLLQCEKTSKEAFINEATVSLFRSLAIPLWVRLFIPVCIVGNIGLFLSGHLSLGATVTIVATVGEQTVQAANFYDFSVARSTIEIWKAGGKALAMLILIVSGIWPYTKQVVTFALWFTPPRSLSTSKRGSILLWFDTLAKWSFVDIFVLVVTVAGFRVSVQSPSVDFLPDKFYSLDLLVVPLWGLYANMIAQIVSQISSHVIVHYHRRVIEAAEESRQRDRLTMKTAETGLTQDESSEDASSDLHCDATFAGETEALYLHPFSRPHRGEHDQLAVRRAVNRALIPFGGIIVLFVILGSSLPVIRQEVLGIIGIMVESGQNFDNATNSYSLFSIIAMLFEQAKFTGRAADYIGLGSLSIVLVSCVLIVPIIQTGTLLYQWFKPMTKRRRHRLFVAIECLEAWQYAEVFLLAVVVAAWQLGPVSEFMVGSSCETLTDTFAQLVYYGILKPEDAQCFRVDSVIAPGSFILAAGALLLTLLNVFVRMAGEQYFREKQSVSLCLENFDCRDASDAELIDKLEPAPVLFTDRFRWIFTRGERQDQDLAPSEDSEESSDSSVDYSGVASADSWNPDSGRSFSMPAFSSDGSDQCGFSSDQSEIYLR